jgi:hypothetical protein
MKKTGCLLAFLLISACEHPLQTPIPNAPVYIVLNLDYGDSDLVPALATKTFTQKKLDLDRLGFGGVLVINGYTSSGTLNLFAYDLACPHEVSPNVRVIPDTEGKARCPQCQSVYITLWGTGLPEKNSVSKHPLRSYRVRALGRNTFEVLN